MNKIIIYRLSNGRCAIGVCPKKATEQEMKIVAEKDKGDAISWRIADKSCLPENTYFRDAWNDDFANENVEIDMERARNIHMDNIRKARDEALKETDLEFQKNLSNPEVWIELNKRKQTLRDLPGVFDLSVAVTPEALQGLWPQELEQFKDALK